MGFSRYRLIRLSILSSFLAFFLFVLLYVIAAIQYPGGTYSKPDQKRFSFSENYLCDLLDDLTYELADNPAKIYARISLGFLCLGVFLFWTYFPFLFGSERKLAPLSRFCGMLAMLVTVFLSTDNHDTITNISGILGSMALVFAILELFRYKNWTIALAGLLFLAMVILNYYIYESRHWITILPMLQKFTMIIGLGWFIAIGLEVKKKFIV